MKFIKRLPAAIFFALFMFYCVLVEEEEVNE